ncbi:nucleotidyltransferase domain-containing protein [Candidatus Poribacteria bacterium]|nr:nucleotidyltransferase domain-containing protein [Candidatus Poribacteria bacterium]
MTSTDTPLIQTIAQRVVQEYQPERIILFGSHAWGQPTPESDIDLFIVKETPLPPRDRRIMVQRLFFPRHFSLDVLVYTPQELARSLSKNNFFIRQILEKGVVLYDKTRLPCQCHIWIKIQW